MRLENRRGNDQPIKLMKFTAKIEVSDRWLAKTKGTLLDPDVRSRFFEAEQIEMSRLLFGVPDET